MAVSSPSVTLTRRLLPLYIAAFFQGFVLWYTIEKLYMHTIGFDDAGIGLMIAAYSGIMLLVETPSGLLADRWSRKGVLVIASIALIVSSIICGLSQSPPTYIIGAAFWGIFYALYSGTYDSIIYDTLLEHKINSKQYERFYGRVKAVDSVALVISSILGGLVADWVGMQAAFWWTVPAGALSILALLVFKEPTLHKTHPDTSFVEHVTTTFKAISQKGRLQLILALLITISVLSALLFEFSQLWLIALSIPIVTFGVANATLLGSSGLAGLATEYLKLHQKTNLLAVMAVTLVVALGLTVPKQPALVVLCQVTLGFTTIALSIVLMRFLHESLPSQVRAGASSAVSTLCRIVLIPLALLFGWVSSQTTIFGAAWLFVGLAVMAMLLAWRMPAQSAQPSNTTDVADFPPLVLEK